MPVVMGAILPGLPHPLLAPDASPHWRRIRDAAEAAAARIQRAIDEEGADLLVLYSTQWISIIGHQVQADPNPVWTLVDPEFHALGSMPYDLRIDAPFAHQVVTAARDRGLQCRAVAYKGFPIDTGSVVAEQLLNPGNRLPATMVSCNMYADRAETVVLGKAVRDAIDRAGRSAVAVAVTTLSARMHTRPIDPVDDHLPSAKDDEWNRKLLEILGQGRLEDVAQLARTVAAQAHADQKMKAIWWLSAVMGQHNRYRGEVHGYAPIQGTGSAVVTLTPAAVAQGQHEFDEDDVERYHGDLEVLETPALARGVGGALGVPAASRGLGRPGPEQVPVGLAVPAPAPPTGGATRRQTRSTTPTVDRPPTPTGSTSTDAAPRPVGAYPHARRVGSLIYLSGVGPRQPGTDEIPGGAIRDAAGNPQAYDIRAQTRACIENVARILEAAGSGLDRVLDVTAFLVDMDQDFAGYNEVYSAFFGAVGATRTTVAVRALPTPIAVELKVIAAAGDVDIETLGTGG